MADVTQTLEKLADAVLKLSDCQKHVIERLDLLDKSLSNGDYESGNTWIDPEEFSRMQRDLADIERRTRSMEGK